MSPHIGNPQYESVGRASKRKRKRNTHAVRRRSNSNVPRPSTLNRCVRRWDRGKLFENGPGRVEYVQHPARNNAIECERPAKVASATATSAVATAASAAAGNAGGVR